MTFATAQGLDEDTEPCIYYVFNFIVEFIMNGIEKRLEYYR